jgi:hypothetical protein
MGSIMTTLGYKRPTVKVITKMEERSNEIHNYRHTEIRGRGREP